MKRLVTIMLALVLALSLVACGGPDKQPAIDAFNKTSTAFDALANEINANPEACPEELIEVMIDMSGVLSEYKALLESDTELTEEQIADIISEMENVGAWVDEAAAFVG